MQLSAKHVLFLDSWIYLIKQEYSPNVEELSQRVGFAPSTGYRLLKRSEAITHIRERLGVEVVVQKPAIYRTLVRLAKAGDVAAARLILQADGDLDNSINVTTNVTVQNEIAEKSDDELDRMIEEDREALLKLEDACIYSETETIVRRC